MRLSNSSAEILAPIQERVRKIAEGLDPDDQEDFLELDALLRNSGFLERIPSVQRRARRRKFVPRLA